MGDLAYYGGFTHFSGNYFIIADFSPGLIITVKKKIGQLGGDNWLAVV